MRRKPEEHYQVGIYRIGKREGSPVYYRFWYDPEAPGRQTRRKSLATESFEEACRLLDEWYALNVVMRQSPPAEVKLCDVLRKYYQDYGQHIASASSIYSNISTVAKTLEDDLTVAAFNRPAQDRLIKALEMQGRAPGGVKKIFNTVTAAIRWAHGQEMITGFPPLRGKLPDGEGRDGVTIAELARLWDAAEHYHMRAFIMVMICTVCRPAAAVQLTRAQCDLDHRIIDLNPRGRKRTKKRNPVIPMADALRPWIEAAEGHLVQYEGKPVQRMNKPFRAVREAAGLAEDVVPMTIRHTMAKALRARHVPELELAGVMGHAMPNVRTTGRYAKYSPDYLGSCREAIDSIVKEFARLAGRAITPL